ncbi:MAG: SPFH domain-containing protein [Lachnospiraceae bacterium]|nr:SPFH domain-containing protein [Lachnospiraceae bacterium]
MMIETVIKWENNPSEVVHKHILDAIPLGSQLVVYPAQTAIFVKGGQIFDVFNSGTYTIKSENIPLLSKLINLPFGGESPFQAEVWFVNQNSILDCKFGTATPLQIEDPQYHIIVPIRSYGQYGIKIEDGEKFLTYLVGNMASFSLEDVKAYFRGVITRKLGTIIAQKIYQDSISILTLPTQVDAISEYAQEELVNIFNGYGISLLRFDIMAITPDENDISFRKLKEAKDTAAKIDIISVPKYQMERSFNVLDNAASNSGNGIVGSAVGLGAGFAVGQQVGVMAGSLLNTNPMADTVYYLAINGVPKGSFTFAQVSEYLANGFINANTLVWVEGMPSWMPISSRREFANLMQSNNNSMPPIPPIP